MEEQYNKDFKFSLYPSVHSAQNMHLEKLSYATLLLVYSHNGLQVSRIPVSVFLPSDMVQKFIFVNILYKEYINNIKIKKYIK